MRVRRARAREEEEDQNVFPSTRAPRTGRPSTTGTTPSRAGAANCTQGEV